MHTVEAVVGAAAKDAIDVDAGLIIVISATGYAARMVAKYRPNVPVMVVTADAAVARQCGGVFALYPYHVPSLPSSR